MNEFICRACGGAHLTGACTGDARVNIPAIQRSPERPPSVIVKLPTAENQVRPLSKDQTVQVMDVIKPREPSGSVNVTDQRKVEITQWLELETPEAKQKIANTILFNLRGNRVNRNLPPKDFVSLADLEESLGLLPILETTVDHTMAIEYDKKGMPSNVHQLPGSKIVEIPLSGLKIAGVSAEVVLKMNFVVSTGNNSFEVLGVSMQSDKQAPKPGLIKRLFGGQKDKK